MFKKRSRPVNARDKASEAAPASSDAAAAGPDDAESSTGTLQELLLLRKYGKQQAGIDLLKLNQGEQKKKAKKKKDEGEADETAGYGLQKKVPAGGESDSDDDDEAQKAKRLVRANNFTQQTNALDVDKHMMAYIETELAKRRGIDPSKEQEGEKEYDPQEELFRIAEKYRVEKKQAVEEEEGNVTTSMGMLTSIPEVDLGMDVRLKNIEETEKAKRAMIEARKKGGTGKKRQEADENFAAARFYRPNYKIQTDTEALEDARREAMDLPPINRTRRPGGESIEVATDEAVYERFKKRIRKN